MHGGQISMPRLKGGAEVLEDRRRRALELLDAGHSLNEVGRLIQCDASSVMRWRDARERGGVEGLKVRLASGRPPRLSAIQGRHLEKVLLKGPLAYGYGTDLWTTARIAEVVEKEFGVHYHRDHIGRLMHGLNWSHQKPERRATQRNEEEIERWKREEWRRIKKKPRGWVPTSSL
jgi:transposase